MSNNINVGWGKIVLIILGFFLLCGACGIVSYATNLGGFWVDAQVNNKIVQPIQRSKLDADANYRRSVEAQAQGIIARYNKHKAALPSDEAAMADFSLHNPTPWTFMQQQQYANLQATLTDDQQGIAQAATDYNSLVNNPDNAGLLTFDPSLPANLDPTIPTPVN